MCSLLKKRDQDVNQLYDVSIQLFYLILTYAGLGYIS